MHGKYLISRNHSKYYWYARVIILGSLAQNHHHSMGSTQFALREKWLCEERVKCKICQLTLACGESHPSVRFQIDSLLFIDSWSNSSGGQGGASLKGTTVFAFCVPPSFFSFNCFVQVLEEAQI